MDVHHVGDEYAHILKQQRQTLQKAKSRQGERPRDRTPKEEAYMQFMMRRMMKQDQPGYHMMHSSFIPPSYHPCIVPVTALQCTWIRDLQLEIHHRGTYLVLRSLTPPNRMTAIMALMEDEHGDATLLQLYQQEDEETCKATNVVNTGTILLIKEPYYKIMSDGNYGLRVDHVSDVLRLDHDDEKVPKAWHTNRQISASAEALKLAGNRAMGEGRYWDAVRDYTNALRQPTTEEEIATIKRNRSLAHIKLESFDAALSDTCFPKFDHQTPEKELFRAAEALYHLMRFEECVDVLEVLHTRYPGNTVAKRTLDRARNRVQEEKTGQYDFRQFQRSAQTSIPPRLDYATFVGPVEVRETGSKGRGLFTTAAVKSGDLLLCEKAFACAFVDDKSCKSSLLINAETKCMFLGAQADLISYLVRKLRHNPSVSRDFTRLHRGAYEGVETGFVDSQPIIDTFLVERIMSLNVFGCGTSSLQSFLKPSGSADEEEKHHSCGIWIQASYVNHDCNPNAYRAFIGDMMVVRASRDLPSGSEVMFSYIDRRGEVSKVNEQLKHWGFKCDCPICKDHRSTKASVLRLRQGLRKELEAVIRSSAPIAEAVPERVEAKLKRLDQTYAQPTDVVPRTAVWDVHFALARAYAALDQKNKCVASIGKTLGALGFVVVGADHSTVLFEVVKWGLMITPLVGVFTLAQETFMALAQYGDAQQAERYARTAFRIVVGEDESFKGHYHDMMH